jgi:hypothetical protein
MSNHQRTESLTRNLSHRLKIKKWVFGEIPRPFSLQFVAADRKLTIWGCS